MKRSAHLIAGLTLVSLIFAAPANAEDFGPVKPVKTKKALADLGKRLFYDNRLSGDTSLSCSSCHQPDKAFTDGKALSTAYTGSEHFRNTPTLANVGRRAAWFHDGRLGTNLNDVTRESLTETYFMNMDMRIMQERLKQDPVYIKLFKAAGKGEPSNGGVRSAIQEFLKSITSSGAPFDTGNLSASAKAGFALFKGKGRCAECHTGPRFTDDKPHSTGVVENPQIWSNPDRHVTFVTYAKFMGVENYMNIRRDLGAYVRDHKQESAGTFMTPTLRELTYTAPYMHNGMIKTLKDVVEFYNRGGGNSANKDKRLQPLSLSDKEKTNLVDFLKSLSGNSFDVPSYNPGDFDTEYPLIANWRKQKN